ncbi:MAG: hypothetical protein FD156_103 [Nitrospirae bacterium]|nr:MAG: hypothetical protein FD156_103 [Nitrospirota bacterium]
MNDKTDILGVAIVGLGVGMEHSRTYSANRNCKISWFYDIDFTKSERAVKEFGVGKVAPDFDTLLQSNDVQLVSIASYDDTHFEQVVKALNAGKHVFVEKPLCQTLEQLKAVKKVWSEHRGMLKLGSNLVLRSVPLYKWLKKNCGEGMFGEIYSFDGDYLYGRLHKILHGWRGQIDTYSALQGGGIHLIDLMLWITGKKPFMAFSKGNQISTEGTTFKKKDFVSALLFGENDMVSRITVNLGCVHRHQHVVRLFGTEGTFIYDDAGPRLHLTRDPVVMASMVELASLPQTKGALLPDFINAIINNKDITSETEAIFDGISVSIACEKSLQTGVAEIIEYA